jgi:hypothetical protein
MRKIQGVVDTWHEGASLTDAVSWRWVDIDGKESAVPFDELSRLFSSESLPPFTLVWRPGWTTWVAAANVAELVSAVGIERSGPPSPVRPDPALVSPPAPPLERYRGVTQKTLLGLVRTKPQPTVPPPPPPRPKLRLPDGAKASRPDLPAVPPPIVSMPPAPIHVRDVLPTLAGEDFPTRSQTLRPAGALPPPPRTYPQQKLPEFEELEQEVDAEEALTAIDPDELTPVPPRGATRSAPPPMPVQTGAPPLAKAEPASPVTSVLPAKGRVSRRAVTIATALSVLIPGAALLLAAFYLKRPKAPEAEEPARVVTLPPQTATAPVGCTLAAPARRLEEAAYASVPLLTAKGTDGKALVGFAATKERAVGLAIDPTTLEVTQAFDQTVSDSTTLGVVPLVHGDPVAFAVDRGDKAFAFSRTVDAAQRFSLGVTQDGFARRVGADVTQVWPGKSDNPTITTPRVSDVNGIGHAVAFRHGGQEGKVLVGWLEDDGSKRSELKAVGADMAVVGTPSVASNEHTTLVSFAAKKTPEEAFHAELSTAENGALPEHAIAFVVPEGGPGGEVISPSAEGLSQGRFLLQWTEGSAGNRAVRVQVLSVTAERTLVPVGDAITLSNRDQNAGQGALWVDGEHALALYLVKNEASHELWGAALRCP